MKQSRIYIRQSKNKPCQKARFKANWFKLKMKAYKIRQYDAMRPFFHEFVSDSISLGVFIASNGRFKQLVEKMQNHHYFRY